MKRLKIVVTLLVLMLSACGKNGALYLPDQAADNQKTQQQDDRAPNSQPQEQN
ncbi:LPS translocon maturation chaperone LptM [Bowmanella denitrificans]|uniref:LPS translocon maturation chaperone LptM n=1 Tax=Bowmanella denitrificans TaxID=366582 RepID=UPI0031E18028